jgi:hypothetical protein
MSANECLRQLGEAWGFPTADIRGQRIMAMRDLALLVYGYDNTANINDMLRRFNRSPLYLQSYNARHKVQIRKALGIRTHATVVSLATWADLLIIGMRGHTDGAKRLQAYLLKAERENRIHWTIEQLQEGSLLQRATAHLIHANQIGWSKQRNDLLFREGVSVRDSWRQSHLGHTGKTSTQLAALIGELGLKDIRRPGERLSILQVIRAIQPEAGASISAESEYMVRGIPQMHAQRISVKYIQPLARELRQFGIRIREEVDFSRDVEEEAHDDL